jgi:rubredoxin
MAKFKCDVCDYIYDEDKEGPIPADYVCVVCGVDRSHFKKI